MDEGGTRLRIYRVKINSDTLWSGSDVVSALSNADALMTGTAQQLDAAGIDRFVFSRDTAADTLNTHGVLSTPRLDGDIIAVEIADMPVLRVAQVNV